MKKVKKENSWKLEIRVNGALFTGTSVGRKKYIYENFQEAYLDVERLVKEGYEFDEIRIVQKR